MRLPLTCANHRHNPPPVFFTATRDQLPTAPHGVERYSQGCGTGFLELFTPLTMMSTSLNKESIIIEIKRLRQEIQVLDLYAMADFCTGPLGVAG